MAVQLSDHLLLFLISRFSLLLMIIAMDIDALNHTPIEPLPCLNFVSACLAFNFIMHPLGRLLQSNADIMMRYIGVVWFKILHSLLISTVYLHVYGFGTVLQ